MLHLLLTDDISKTKPETCKVIMNFGTLSVFFADEIRTGLNCIVEDTDENIVNWLKPYDGFVKGVGSPMLERFSIVHISNAIKNGNKIEPF
jgi:hypothetical protein